MTLKQVFALSVSILGLNFAGGGLLGLIHFLIEDRRLEVLWPIIISILIGVILIATGLCLMNNIFDTMLEG